MLQSGVRLIFKSWNKLKMTFQSFMYSFPVWRKHYWNIRAEKLHRSYGEYTHDFEILSDLMDADFPESLLDFGCGSGRLIPLYLDRGIPNIHCYDISEDAIALARSHVPGHAIRFITSLEELANGGVYYDLIVCTRVLQHIPVHEIKRVLDLISRLGRRIYLNEATRSISNHFVFAHDYRLHFEQHDFFLERQGVINDPAGNSQEWFLFTRLKGK